MQAPVIAERSCDHPVLRAGIGMADGLQELIPFGSRGHIGLYRDETTGRSNIWCGCRRSTAANSYFAIR